MNYLLFEKAFLQFTVFSIKDIKKRFPDFDNRRLVEWQQKAYIQKLKRAYYCFREQERNEFFLYFVANKTYSPSYISFENALAYYNFIPEAVFLISSATTKNTANYEISDFYFAYRHIKPKLFFGYKLVQKANIVVKIAEPEKALLDYFYLHKINTIHEMQELRLNKLELKEILNFEKLDKYLKIFNSKVLNRRIKLLKTMIYA